MTDLDPAIWDNPTLGAAANNVRLDALEKQELEDRNAKIEGRAPREVIVENDYPGWTPKVEERTGTVPSNYQVVHFADEQPNDVPVDSAPVDETAQSVQDVPAEPTATENTVSEPAPAEESDPTQWT